MDESELWKRGLMTLGLGPDGEWDPVDPEQFQRRHDQWWRFVAEVTELEYTDAANDDDLPHWMSEEATQRLLKN